MNRLAKLARRHPVVPWKVALYLLATALGGIVESQGLHWSFALLPTAVLLLAALARPHRDEGFGGA